MPQTAASCRSQMLLLLLIALLIASVADSTTQVFTGAQTALEVVIQPTDTYVEIDGVTNNGILRVKAASPNLLPGLVVRITNNVIDGSLCFGCAWSSNTEEMNLFGANITISSNEIRNTNGDNPWFLIGRSDTSATNTLRFLDSHLVVTKNTVQTRGIIFANTRTAVGTTTLTNTKVFFEENTLASHLYIGGSEIDSDVCTLNILRGTEIHVRNNNAYSLQAAYAQRGIVNFNMDHGSVLAIQDNTFTTGGLRIAHPFVSSGGTSSRVNLYLNSSRIFVYKNSLPSGDLSFGYTADTSSRLDAVISDTDIFYQQNHIQGATSWIFFFRAQDPSQITATATRTNFYIKDNTNDNRAAIFATGNQGSSDSDVQMVESNLYLEKNTFSAEVYINLGEFGGISRLSMIKGSRIVVRENSATNLYATRSPQGEAHLVMTDSSLTVESNTFSGAMRMGHALNSNTIPSVPVTMTIYGSTILFTKNSPASDTSFALASVENTLLTTTITNSEVIFLDNTIAGNHYIAYTSQSAQASFTATNTKFVVEGNTYGASSSGILGWSVAPLTTTATQGTSILSNNCNITIARNTVKNGIFLFRSGGSGSTNDVTFSDSTIQVEDNSVAANSILFGYTINGASLNLAMTNSDVLFLKNQVAAGNFLGAYSYTANSPVVFSMVNSKVTLQENVVNLGLFLIFASTSASITASVTSASVISIIGNTVQTQTLQVAATATSSGTLALTDSTINIHSNELQQGLFVGYARDAAASLITTASSNALISIQNNVARSSGIFLGYSLNGATNTFHLLMSSLIKIHGNRIVTGNLYVVDAGWGSATSTSILTADSSHISITHNHLVSASINIVRAWQDCIGNLYLSSQSSLTVESNSMASSLLTLGYPTDGGTATLQLLQGSLLTLRNNTAVTLRVVYADKASSHASLSFHEHSNFVIDGSAFSSSAFIGYGNEGGNAMLWFNQSTLTFAENSVVYFYFGYARETDSRTSLRFQDGSAVTLQQNTLGNSIYFNSANGMRTQSNVTFTKDSPLTITNNQGGSYFLGYAWNNGSTHSLTFSANSPLKVTSNTEMSHIYCFYCASGGSSFTTLSTTSSLDISGNALRSVHDLFLSTPGAGCAQSRLHITEDPLYLLSPGSSSPASVSLSVNNNQDVQNLRVLDTRGTTVPYVTVSAPNTAAIDISVSGNTITTALAVVLSSDRLAYSPWSSSSSVKINQNQLSAGTFYASFASPVNNVEIDKNRLKSTSASDITADAYSGSSAALHRVLGCNWLTDETLAGGASLFWQPSTSSGGAQDFQGLSGCTRTVSMSVPLPPSPGTPSSSSPVSAPLNPASADSSSSNSPSSSSLYFEVTFSTTPTVVTGSSSSSLTSSYTPPTTSAEFAQMIATRISSTVGRTVDPVSEILVLEFNATAGTASYQFIGDNAASLTSAASSLDASDLGLLSVSIKMIITSASNTPASSSGTSTNGGGSPASGSTTSLPRSDGIGGGSASSDAEIQLGPGNGPAAANNLQTGGLSSGEQAAIIIGAAVFVGLMVGLLLFLVLRKKLKNDLSQQQMKTIEQSEMAPTNFKGAKYTPQETSIFA